MRRRPTRDRRPGGLDEAPEARPVVTEPVTSGWPWPPPGRPGPPRPPPAAESPSDARSGQPGRRRRGMAFAAVALGAVGLVGAVLVAALVVAGEDGPDGAGRRFTRRNLRQVGAQPSDLPPGYTAQPGLPRQATSVHHCLEAATRHRADLANQLRTLGMRGCYDAAYVKTVGTAANRPGSTAYLFEDAAGASKALPLLRTALVEGYRGAGGLQSAHDVPVSGLGDESLPGRRFVTVGGGEAFTLTLYVWRIGNVVASFAATDTLRDMNDQAILDIAKRIDSRARA